MSSHLFTNIHVFNTAFDFRHCSVQHHCCSWLNLLFMLNHFSKICCRPSKTMYKEVCCASKCLREMIRSMPNEKTKAVERIYYETDNIFCTIQKKSSLHFTSFILLGCSAKRNCSKEKHCFQSKQYASGKSQAYRRHI